MHEALGKRLTEAGWICRDRQSWDSGPGPDLVRVEFLGHDISAGRFAGHYRSWRAELRDIPDDLAFAFLQWAAQDGAAAGDGGGGRLVIEGTNPPVT